MTPLFAKLNYKGHTQIVVLNAPVSMDEDLRAMEAATTVVRALPPEGGIAFAMAFVTTQEELDAAGAALAPLLEGDAVLWFCYPKQSSKRYKSQIHRDHGWDGFAQYGLEPVRSVAIDEDWSAIRFRKVQYIKSMTRSFAMTEEGKRKVEEAKK